MDKKKRKLLIFTEKWGEGCLKTLLEQQEWQVYQTDNYDQAIKLIRRHQLNVCIAQLGFLQGDHFLQQTKSLMSCDSNINWLFILPENDEFDIEQTPFAQQLIKGFCFDYHRLPAQMDRLYVILGHAYGMAEIRRQASVVSKTKQSKYGIIGQSPCLLGLKKDRQSRPRKFIDFD